MQIAISLALVRLSFGVGQGAAPAAAGMTWGDNTQVTSGSGTNTTWGSQ